MDTRYYELRSLADRAGTDTGLVSAGALNGTVALLRGYLAELGTLAEPAADHEAVQAAGVLAGRVLLAAALADAARAEWLTPAQWQRYTAQHRVTTSCVWLMDKLNGLRRYVREQQATRSLAYYKLTNQPLA